MVRCYLKQQRWTIGNGLGMELGSINTWAEMPLWVFLEKRKFIEKSQQKTFWQATFQICDAGMKEFKHRGNEREDVKTLHWIRGQLTLQRKIWLMRVWINWPCLYLYIFSPWKSHDNAHSQMDSMPFGFPLI